MEQQRQTQVANEDMRLCDLLSEVRAGHPAAFPLLLARYDRLLRSQAARFGRDPHEVEDAYQDACIAFHRAACTFREGKNVTFGLYAKICITHALITKYRRAPGGVFARGGKKIDLVPYEEDRFFAEFSDRMVERENFLELLGRIRAELSPYERQVFDLYAEGVSVPDMSRTLGRDEKSVRNAVSRLLVKLRSRLRP